MKFHLGLFLLGNFRQKEKATTFVVAFSLKNINQII